MLMKSRDVVSLIACHLFTWCEQNSSLAHIKHLEELSSLDTESMRAQLGSIGGGLTAPWADRLPFLDIFFVVF